MTFAIFVHIIKLLVHEHEPVSFWVYLTAFHYLGLYPFIYVSPLQGRHIDFVMSVHLSVCHESCVLV